MSVICEKSVASSLEWEPLEKRISLNVSSKISAPDEVVANLAAIEGEVDIYCWYEGLQGLPQVGAFFMKRALFEPLFALKSDVTLRLYSLRGWDFAKNVAGMSTTTPLGEAINRINRVGVECIYASSFFRYCRDVSKESPLYNFISKELPKKEYLYALSEGIRENGAKVASLFNGQDSIFDCIKDLDLARAYSLIQYVEGYYLIQESIKRGLSKGQRTIEIAFVLPNDEGKYYLDLPEDIETMLRLDFGDVLNEVQININFQFFEYGESLGSRPYIDKRRGAQKVKPQEIAQYLEWRRLV